MTPPSPAIPESVQRVLDSYPEPARKALARLRGLVFETAAALPATGALTETLKWGEPAYLTAQSGAGTTLRMAWKAGAPDTVSLFVNCRTSLVDGWRERFGDALTLVGDREIRLSLDQPLPLDLLQACIVDTLTYHLGKP